LHNKAFTRRALRPGDARLVLLLAPWDQVHLPALHRRRKPAGPV